MRYEVIHLSEEKHRNSAALYVYILDSSEDLAVINLATK